MPVHALAAPQAQPSVAAASNPESALPEMDRELLYTFPVQLKPSVGAPDDPLEHEADAMADRVMRVPEPFVQRKCVACKNEEEEQKINRKPLSAQITPFIQRSGSDTGGTASAEISNRIAATKGGGAPMSSHTQSFMESRFGADFSGVKVHTGDYASQMSGDLNAQAFTVGRDIYFNDGKYAPESPDGGHLLAHELTHVVQQKADSSIQRQTSEGEKKESPRIGNHKISESDYQFVLESEYIKHHGTISHGTASNGINWEAIKDENGRVWIKEVSKNKTVLYYENIEMPKTVQSPDQKLLPVDKDIPSKSSNSPIDNRKIILYPSNMNPNQGFDEKGRKQLGMEGFDFRWASKEEVDREVEKGTQKSSNIYYVADMGDLQAHKGIFIFDLKKANRKKFIPQTLNLYPLNGKIISRTFDVGNRSGTVTISYKTLKEDNILTVVDGNKKPLYSSGDVTTNDNIITVSFPYENTNIIIVTVGYNNISNRKVEDPDMDISQIVYTISAE